MASKTKDDILAALRAYIGEDTQDAALAIIEDVSDTLDEVGGDDGEDWKAKYAENDAAWRKRYRDRFFGSEAGEEDGEGAKKEQKENVEEDAEDKDFDDLFEDREG